MEENQKQLNIFQRMARASAEIKKVSKSLTVAVNQKSSYKAVSIEGIVDAVIPVCEKYGIYIQPLKKEILKNEIINVQTQYGEKVSFFVRLKSTYRFVNIDRPDDYVEAEGYGDGIDTGDKACGKADTYARKYALITAFNISIGEDPDTDPSEENADEMKKSGERTASENQLKILRQAYKGDDLEKLLKANNISKIEEIPMKKASELIAIIMEKKKS